MVHNYAEQLCYNERYDIEGLRYDKRQESQKVMEEVDYHQYSGVVGCNFVRYIIGGRSELLRSTVSPVPRHSDLK